VGGSKTDPEIGPQADPQLASHKSELVSHTDPETDPQTDPQPMSRKYKPEVIRFKTDLEIDPLTDPQPVSRRSEI
jgi:hypothetical protein